MFVSIFVYAPLLQLYTSFVVPNYYVFDNCHMWINHLPDWGTDDSRLRCACVVHFAVPTEQLIDWGKPRVLQRCLAWR